jgi:hypothetical protein
VIRHRQLPIPRDVPRKFSATATGACSQKLSAVVAHLHTSFPHGHPLPMYINPCPLHSCLRLRRVALLVVSSPRYPLAIVVRLDTPGHIRCASHGRSASPVYRRIRVLTTSHGVHGPRRPARLLPAIVPDSRKHDLREDRLLLIYECCRCLTGTLLG